MSMKPHTPKPKEHGTAASYIVGFILSLIFTVIPYYLVVNKTITGNALLITILGFAFIQMLIQIFFFLHLGRGPKPLYNVVFFVATAGLIAVVVGGSIFIMNNLYQNMSPSEVTIKQAEGEGIAHIGHETTGACQGLKENHKVTIRNGQVNPVQTQANQCDTLTFINEDSQVRVLKFGPQSYGGEFDQTVHKGRPESITLNQIGSYTFKDIYDSSALGYFYVTGE